MLVPLSHHALLLLDWVDTTHRA